MHILANDKFERLHKRSNLQGEKNELFISGINFYTNLTMLSTYTTSLSTWRSNCD